MTDNEKMKMVLKLARQSLQDGELPIAAIIFKDEKIIVEARTSEKSDKRLLVHAELKALMQLDSMSVPISEKRKMCLFTNLEPCMMCLGAIISSFVGEVCYAVQSNSDGAAVWADKTWKDFHTDSPFRLPDIRGGVLADECKELFSEYVGEHKSGPYVEWLKTVF